MRVIHGRCLLDLGNFLGMFWLMLVASKCLKFNQLDSTSFELGSDVRNRSWKCSMSLFNASRLALSKR